MQIPETVSTLREGITENCYDPVYPPELKISEIIEWLRENPSLLRDGMKAALLKLLAEVFQVCYT
jgi:hypothetical protein